MSVEVAPRVPALSHADQLSSSRASPWYCESTWNHIASRRGLLWAPLIAAASRNDSDPVMTGTVVAFPAVVSVTDLLQTCREDERFP